MYMGLSYERVFVLRLLLWTVWAEEKLKTVRSLQTETHCGRNGEIGETGPEGDMGTRAIGVFVGGRAGNHGNHLQTSDTAR